MKIKIKKTTKNTSNTQLSYNFFRFSTLNQILNKKMSSSVATAPESPSHLEELNQQQQQQPLTRNPTAPSSFNASPKPVHEMQRQSSASGSMASAPVHAVTAYLKHLFGYSAKPTKRSLSEEAECGSPESLSEWLRQGSNPNEFDAYGYSPLINACLR